MSFQNPWALLVLIAIPILIVIYLLRNRFREATAPSTYLWELSEKFLKRRNPLHKFEHLFALIVQCLTVACLAVTLAHPVLTIPGGSENYLFILDASASMNLRSENGDRTRFEEAKARIENQVNNAAQGSSYSLILSDTESRVVCTQVTDKTRFELYLDSVGVSTSASTLEDAMTQAQSLFSQGLCSVGYLATDKFPQSADTKASDDKNNKLNIIDVSSDVTNRALSDLTYSYRHITNSKDKTDNYQLTISCNVTSYGKAAVIPVHFFVNDEELTQVTAECNTPGETANVSYTYIDESEIYRTNPIQTIRAQIASDPDDGLKADDSMILYAQTATAKPKVLLVGSVSRNDVFYIALNSLGCDVTIEAYSAYDAKTESGFDITIFDGISGISELPDGGACWFVNSYVTDPAMGFTQLDVPQKTSQDAQTLAFTEDADSPLYNTFMQNVNSDRPIYVSSFYPLGNLVNGLVTLMTLNYNNSEYPMVIGGKVSDVQCATEVRDVREMIFSFDVHDSNLPMLSTFIVLLYNFIQYSVPTLLTKLDYVVGDSATFSVPDNTKYITVEAPDGTKEIIEKADLTDFYDYMFTQFGTYTITNTFTSSAENDKTYKAYVAYPKEEENPSATEEKTYTLIPATDAKSVDGYYDSLLPITIVSAVLFALDWFLYAHEQY